MSYEIMYDRRFIDLGDGRYVPMVQQGSNNCFEFSSWGRQVPEKYWTVYKYCFPVRHQYAFTLKELKEMASVKGLEWFKSRYKKMTDEEFQKYFTAGIKSAKKIEEYVEMRNGFYFKDENTQRYITTTEELKSIIWELEVNKNTKAKLLFDVRDFNTKKERQATTPRLTSPMLYICTI